MNSAQPRGKDRVAKEGLACEWTRPMLASPPGGRLCQGSWICDVGFFLRAVEAAEEERICPWEATQAFLGRLKRQFRSQGGGSRGETGGWNLCGSKHGQSLRTGDMTGQLFPRTQTQATWQLTAFADSSVRSSDILSGLCRQGIACGPNTHTYKSK